MIVVDTNILTYLYLPTAQTAAVEQLLQQQPDWVAPRLWRSELRNVLALYLRKQLLSLAQAVAIQTEAELLLADREYDVKSLEVLTLAQATGCSAYDCEFVVLAKRLGVPLVTADKKVLSSFPNIAQSIEQILA